jgi:hypothetical protein
LPAGHLLDVLRKALPSVAHPQGVHLQADRVPDDAPRQALVGVQVCAEQRDGLAHLELSLFDGDAAVVPDLLVVHERGETTDGHGRVDEEDGSFLEVLLAAGLDVREAGQFHLHLQVAEQEPLEVW